MRKYDAKSFQGDFKTYQYFDMSLVKKIENNDATDIKVYQSRLVHSTSTPTTQALYFEKHKVSSVLFPSTMNVHRITYVRKLVFRLNHRMFVNFVIEKEQGSDQKHYKVFLNYNASKDADVPTISAYMDKIVADFTPQIEVPTSGT